MRTLVFDLDGTLTDTAPDLAAAVNRLMASRGLAEFAVPEVAAMVGDGVGMLIERAFAAHGRTPDAAALHDYIADYNAHTVVATRLYPGVAPALRALVARNWRLAVCTNKPEQASRTLLATLGVGDCFAAIGGGDSFPVRKPDPEHLHATLRAAGGSPERALMVGDNRNDIAAAAGLGMHCIFAAWGYGRPGMSEGAAAIAQSFGEIPNLAERLLPETPA